MQAEEEKRTEMLVTDACVNCRRRRRSAERCWLLMHV